MKKIFLISISLMLVAFVSNQIIKKEANAKSYVKYFMSHPAHDWGGISKSVKCMIAEQNNKIVKVAVSIPISSFDSDNASRDSHTLEVVEALKYPSVNFTSTKISYLTDSTLSVLGNMTFHNVTKAVQFTAKTSQAKKTSLIDGKVALKLTDYNITPPTFMLVPIKDQLDIVFHIEVDK